AHQRDPGDQSVHLVPEAAGVRDRGEGRGRGRADPGSRLTRPPPLSLREWAAALYSRFGSWRALPTPAAGVTRTHSYSRSGSDSHVLLSPAPGVTRTHSYVPLRERLVHLLRPGSGSDSSASRAPFRH